MWWIYLLYSLLGILAILIVVVLIRAIAFNAKPSQTSKPLQLEFDCLKATTNLSSLIKFKTISNVDPNLEDDEEFKNFEQSLPSLYPNVYDKCELMRFDNRSLLFRWAGKSSKSAVVLMAHYDVVSVEEENWKQDPFAGNIVDGYLWGRGTLDTKVTFNAIMFSVNHLIETGFTPERDVYMAFSGGEEVNGLGAVRIKDYFKNNNIDIEFVLDEGGAVVDNVFPGVKQPCGLIGIAEKGLLNVKYTVKSNGGHASAPKPNSPLVKLSKAVTKLDKNPFKYKISKPVKELLDTVGRRSSFLFKIIFANLWLFKGVLNLLGRKSGGEINALIRTTVAITQAEGSKGINVLPAVASINSNMRLIPGDDKDKALKVLRKTVGDDIDISVINYVNPSRVSVSDSFGYGVIKDSILNTWDGCFVSPYLMVQCSDCRHYGENSDKVYRFSAMKLTTEDRASIHGNNEKISLKEIEKSVEFYLRVIKNC